MNTPAEFTNLILLLHWLAGPLGITSWMNYYSNLLRNLHEANLKDPNLKLTPWGKKAAAFLQKLSPEVMQLVHAGGSLLVPAIAIAILEFVPPERLSAIQPYYATFSMLFIAYLASQVWYLWTKSGTDGSVIAQSILQTGPVTNTGGLDELRPEPGEPSFEDQVLDLRGVPGVTTTELDTPQEFGEREPLSIPQPIVKPPSEPMGRVFSIDTAQQREIQRNRDEVLARNLARECYPYGRMIA